MSDDPGMARLLRVGVEDADPEHRERFASSRRTAAAIRTLIELLHEKALSDEESAEVATEVEAIAGRLAPLSMASRYESSPPVVVGDDRFLERYEFGLGGRSTVTRTNHTFTVDGSRLTGQVTFGLINEGAVPGFTTGPWIAYVLDLAMAAACTAVDLPGLVVTNELKIRYRRPVPILVALEVAGRVESVEETRLLVGSEILYEGNLLVRGEAVMSLVASPRGAGPPQRA